jgi:hypothetical protein
MPSHVRIFWWLSVAIVAYWILGTAWFLAFPPHPSARILAMLAKMPPDLRNIALRAERQGEIIRIISTVIWSGLTLGFAWFAAHRHANWARLAFLVLFVIRESVPHLAMFVSYYQMHHLDFFWATLARENWTNPRGYLVPALATAAIAFVFSGNARDWFRAPRLATADTVT